MKKGFTLLEIIIVIIIIGILATLGFTQYSKMVERSRGAEARSIAGDIRKFGAAYRLEYGTVPSGQALLDATNIGTTADKIPSTCAPTHYFSYNAANTGANSMTITATRCAAGGKNPQGGASAGMTYVLSVDYGTGNDVVSGNGSY